MLRSGAQVAQTSVQIGGGVATAIGTAAHAAWVPFVGPIVAGVGVAIALIANRKGPRQKVATTQIVDELEPLLAENLDGYFSGPRTAASQAAALKNFDDAWAWLTSSQACGSADMGNPGKACISDRQRGGKWDWFAMYRDPIEQDKTVQAPASIATPLQSLFTNASEGGSAAWLMPAALIALAVAL